MQFSRRLSQIEPLVKAFTLSILVFFSMGAQARFALGKAEVPALIGEYPELCRIGAGHYGPFDYRSAPQSQRSLVEDYHFDGEVEALVRGITSGSPGGDIAYTLRAFPNHPRALASLVRLEIKERRSKPAGLDMKVPCWFERALVLYPNDHIVRAMYGAYALRKGAKEDAVRLLERAREELGDAMPANDLYNLGLAYLEVGRVEDAHQVAKVVYAAGIQFPGLKERLKKLGQPVD